MGKAQRNTGRDWTGRIISLEPISKMWIRTHGKARFGEKAESRLRRDELILRRFATPPWALRRFF
jgi:hypothetical protein